MKYRRLTKEQLETLHEEFAKFLATQSIDVSQWEDIKKNNKALAEEEIDLFSDMVWDRILDKVNYLENINAKEMQLFQLGDNNMRVLVIQVDSNADITTPGGYKWLQDNLMDDRVKMLTATREYTDNRKSDKFKLIEQGGNITEGALFQYFKKLIG